jgi:hypothetical protein
MQKEFRNEDRIDEAKLPQPSTFIKPHLADHKAMVENDNRPEGQTCPCDQVDFKNYRDG